MRLQRGTYVPSYRQTLKSCTKSINTGRTMFSPVMDWRFPLGITTAAAISNVIETWFMLTMLTRVLYLKLKHYQQWLMVYYDDAWRGTEIDASQTCSDGLLQLNIWQQVQLIRNCKLYARKIGNLCYYV